MISIEDVAAQLSWDKLVDEALKDFDFSKPQLVRPVYIAVATAAFRPISNDLRSAVKSRLKRRNIIYYVKHGQARFKTLETSGLARVQTEEIRKKNSESNKAVWARKRALKELQKDVREECVGRDQADLHGGASEGCSAGDKVRHGDEARLPGVGSVSWS